MRLQWNAWTWGIRAREREALAIQQQIVAADEAAFARALETPRRRPSGAIDGCSARWRSTNGSSALREQVAALDPGSSPGGRRDRVGIPRSERGTAAGTLRPGRPSGRACAGERRFLTTLGLEVR